MSYEVVVVGGGIGGLTVAALLSQRGVKVCLLERQPEVGGCISTVQHQGLKFEPGFGLYSSWGAGETYDRIFSELGVAKPDVYLLEDDVVIRFRGHDVFLKKDATFNDELRTAFPECADESIKFYSSVERIAGEWKRSAKAGALTTKSIFSKALDAFRPKSNESKELAEARASTTKHYSRATSEPFISFIDAQLRFFLQTPIDECPFLPACIALNRLRESLYSIPGGPTLIAQRLVEAFKASGGTLKLNSPVLRLAYNEGGAAIGVDLLSGERVVATRAVVSNMTIWDTYGKLVGLDRTPPQAKKEIASLVSSGVFQIFAAMRQTVVERLPSQRILVVSDQAEEDQSAAFSFTTMPGPGDENIGATFTSQTEVEDWFSFQQDEDDAESRDQAALEMMWRTLHRSMPEFGPDLEVLETSTPKTYYEQTRRKLGYVMGYRQSARINRAAHAQVIPNLFMVGDTASDGVATLDSIVDSALALANTLNPQ